MVGMTEHYPPGPRRKFTWGRGVVTFASILAFMLAAAPMADAAGRAAGKNGAKSHHAKLDSALNEVADGAGETDVIIEFNDDTDSQARIKAYGGKSGRKLGILHARAGRMPNALLKRLADDPKVKRIHKDRAAEGFNGRTAVTIGQRNVTDVMGYTGSGVGVAVIDSGITNWHDDLTVANRQGQRVAAFVDFVNGRTTPYDDWGHGTHVAGIVAGNGYDSLGTRKGMAPKASIIALKALDAHGKGKISDIIAALDWAVTNQAQYNIRVINMSLGAGVFESYNTDPLTLAAKRAVDAGIVVVAAAGNMGKAANGLPQYGAIAAPGNAPWVLTVGASSTMGTLTRSDDEMAGFSSAGPSFLDFEAKPDLVAPGSGTVSLAAKNSTMYVEKALYLLPGTVTGLMGFKPYLTLSGTSMSAPVVAGTVATMIQADPALTPNLVKAILQFTAQVYPQYNALTEGAGFLNSLGAVKLAKYFAGAQKGERYPNMTAWSKQIFWGNKRVTGGVIAPGGTAWAQNIVWGDVHTPAGQNIVWGDFCGNDCQHIVKGNNVVWGDHDDADNIVWGNYDDDNIVWGNSDDDNIVWGNGDDDNIVWGDADDDNIVWGNDCDGADCDNIVWGNTDDDNIVWGNAEDADNIVWGNASDEDNIVWGNSDDDNIVWGNAAEDDPQVFGDETDELQGIDLLLWEQLIEGVDPDSPDTSTPPPTEGQGGLF